MFEAQINNQNKKNNCVEMWLIKTATGTSECKRARAREGEAERERERELFKMKRTAHNQSKNAR